MTDETWLICGGRDFADQAMFDEVMSRLVEMWGLPSKIVHGAAKGADAMADALGETFCDRGRPMSSITIEAADVPQDQDWGSASHRGGAHGCAPRL